MAEQSAIEWCDHTFNPWEGCQKVGPGCDHCYAETRNARYNKGTSLNWGPGSPRRRTSAANWKKPLKWAREANAFGAKHGRRQRVFCASLADVFDNAVDPAWRLDLFKLIDATPELDWLLLTKRIGNVAAMIEEMAPGRTLADLPHVWLGATIVNRDEMLRDGPKLIAVDAAVRFWSGEPLLGDLGEVPSELLPDWVIVGGESGQGARPMHPDWVCSLRNQCAAGGVPFLFKQWGEYKLYEDERADCFWLDPNGHVYGGPTTWPPESDELRAPMCRIGKKHAGRLLDGVTHDGFPLSPIDRAARREGAPA